MHIVIQQVGCGASGSAFLINSHTTRTVDHTLTSKELDRLTGEDNGNPLQYSCLENPMDRGAW